MPISPEACKISATTPELPDALPQFSLCRFLSQATVQLWDRLVLMTFFSNQTHSTNAHSVLAMQIAFHGL